jgi:hypothetical protein
MAEKTREEITQEEVTPLETTPEETRHLEMTPLEMTPLEMTPEELNAEYIADTVNFILAFWAMCKTNIPPVLSHLSKPSKIDKYAICNRKAINLVYKIQDYYITKCGNVIHESSLSFTSKDIYDCSKKLELTWKNSTHFVPFSNYKIGKINVCFSKQEKQGRFIAGGIIYYQPNRGEKPTGFWWIEPERN